MTSEAIKKESEGQICRLCMSEESLEDVFKDEQLREWIWEFLAIKISIDDCMSQVICTICRIRLTEFHQFRTGCHEVQEVLQALIPDRLNGFDADAPVQPIKNQNDSPIRCEVCRMVFKDEKQLMAHKRTHETERYLCTICQKSFETRVYLNDHLEIHTTKCSENQQNTQVKAEQDENIELQGSGSTSKDGKVVSSFLVQSESTDVNSEPKEAPLCLDSFGERPEAEGPSPFQDDEIDNDPLGIEDCIVVEEIKVETGANDEATVETKKRKAVSDIDADEFDDDDSGSDVPLSQIKKLSSRSRNKYDSTDSESDHTEEVKQRSKNDDETYACLKCDRTFKRQCRLNAHMAIHDEKADEKSSHESSDETSTNKSTNCDVTAEDQEKENNSKQVYQCDLCGNVYSNRTQLANHKQYHRKLLRQAAIDNPNLTTTDSPANVEKENSEDQTYQCDVCNKICLTKKIFRVHKRNVHGPKKHKCDICNVQYTLRTQMTRHVYTKKHLIKVQEKLKLENEKSLDINVEVNQDDPKQANKGKSKTKLDANNITDGKNKTGIVDSNLLKDDLFVKYQPFLPHRKKYVEQAKCNVCSKTFPNQWSLSTHKQYHKPKKFVCHVCEKPCHNSTVLTKHLATHVSVVERQQARPPKDVKNAPRPFKCEVCNTAYMDKSTLWRHNMSVHGPRNFECEICGFKFPANDMLMKHVKRHTLRGHTKEDFQALKKLFQQNESTTNQNDDDELSDRSSIASGNETGENDKADNRPNKSDENSSKLSAEHPFQCDLCQKSFETRVLLYRHKRYVHKPKRFKCAVCGKRFAYEQQRNYHMKIHKPESTATKDYECPECHKIYTSWKSLYVHVKNGHVRRRTLPEERTVPCPKCDKMFQTPPQRDLHMRTVHAPGEHKCEICNIKFPIRVKLWQHMKTQHANKSASSGSEDSTQEFDSENSVIEENHSNEASRKQPQRNAKVKKGLKRRRT